MLKFKLIILSNFIGLCATAQTFTGRAVNIADGDTFTLLTDADTTIKVRLHGIDCPEKKMPFGSVAKEFLGQMLEGKRVKVVETDRDRYGRMVALVIVGRDTANISLLRAGLAWHYKKYDKSVYWALIEQDARKNKTGLWIDNSPVAPWEWRHAKK